MNTSRVNLKETKGGRILLLLLEALTATHVKVLLKRMGIALFFLFLSRIVFYIANYDSFTSLQWTDLLASVWFDCITICIYFIPIFCLFLIPFPWRGNRFYRLFFKGLFYVTVGVLLFLNLMDVEYFQFTSKRSTYDIFAIVGAGEDMSQLLLAFLKDFWWLVLLFILFIAVNEWMYRKAGNVQSEKATSRFFLSNTISLLIFVPLFFIVGRGGLGIRPIGIIEASYFTKVENTALILNTPFTMIKSFGKESLELKEYFPQAKADQLFSPLHVSNPQHILPDGTNVMVIILESFGNEFVGAANQSVSYTPFFDSLISQSLYFEYGIANGKKSIEAVPAIIASIPSLMDNPYISSPYGNNAINSLPQILKKKGYESAFFHGATNGSMRFDGFAAQVGFDHYYGRKEYNNDTHFDKTWGILDEYFNPWTAKEISKLKEPFFSTLFTLSSHHPYYVPKNRRDEVIQGPQPICASISYGDYSLRLFFEEAKKQPWFNNTLFVLCADHTPATNSLYYSQRNHMYQIPVVFYHPQKLIVPKREKKIFQHLDILPTLLDMVNIKMKYYSFGNSYYSSSEREAITYIEGSYQYFINNHMYIFSDEKARNLYDFVVRKEYTQDSLSFYKKESEKVEKRLKAIIQRYNRDLILNQTTVD